MDSHKIVFYTHLGIKFKKNEFFKD